jgi:hypothetical protein
MKDQTTFYRLSSADRGIVVFLLWRSLSYRKRLVLSFGLILAGLIIQIVSQPFLGDAGSFLAGVLPILAGNLLLLVRGYNNGVDFGRYDATSAWETADLKKLDELLALDSKIRKWDFSLIDVSNVAGGMVFAVVIGVLSFAALVTSGLTRVLALDAMVLFLPHWITGIRSALVLPRLLIKVRTMRELLQDVDQRLKDDKVELLVLLKGKEKRLPDVIKLRVSLKSQQKDFLGLYTQVVVNEVNGTSYPYLYVVMVAKKGYGLKDAFQKFSPANGMIKEFKYQDDVEVIVIRQETTPRSGYCTDRQMAAAIFLQGFFFSRSVGASEKPA